MENAVLDFKPVALSPSQPLKREKADLGPVTLELEETAAGWSCAVWERHPVFPTVLKCLGPVATREEALVLALAWLRGFCAGVLVALSHSGEA